MTTQLRKRMNPKSVLDLQKALMRGPKCLEELSTLSGLGKPTVSRWVRVMREANVIHRSAWAQDKKGRDFIALYMWGEGQDIARPGRKLSPAEQMAKLRLQRKLQKLEGELDEFNAPGIGQQGTH